MPIIAEIAEIAEIADNKRGREHSKKKSVGLYCYLLFRSSDQSN